jgi:hypothetical protein
VYFRQDCAGIEDITGMLWSIGCSAIMPKREPNNHGSLFRCQKILFAFSFVLTVCAALAACPEVSRGFLSCQNTQAKKGAWLKNGSIWHCSIKKGFKNIKTT